MDDLISRKAAMQAMVDALTWYPISLTEAEELVKDIIGALPSAEPERKKGEVD